jgi:hypothetical protein
MGEIEERTRSALKKQKAPLIRTLSGEVGTNKKRPRQGCGPEERRPHANVAVEYVEVEDWAHRGIRTHSIVDFDGCTVKIGRARPIVRTRVRGRADGGFGGDGPGHWT